MGILASKINNHEKIFGFLGQTKTRWCFLGKKHSVHCLAKMPLKEGQGGSNEEGELYTNKRFL
jgi:hypothetical protein